MIIIPTWLVVILTLCIAFILKCVLKPKRKPYQYRLSPISISMATHHENAKFRIRYRDLTPNQELYKIGLRNGQYGVILKHSSGTYAKTTVNGKCRFVLIESKNYIPTGE